jgi:hypothetical protein
MDAGSTPDAPFPLILTFSPREKEQEADAAVWFGCVRVCSNCDFFAESSKQGTDANFTNFHELNTANLTWLAGTMIPNPSSNHGDLRPAGSPSAAASSANNLGAPLLSG